MYTEDEDFNEVMAFIGKTLDDVTVVANLEGELTLTDISNKFLSFLRSFGFDYIDSIEVHCNHGTTHGSTK